jgi:hypothetical protein
MSHFSTVSTELRDREALLQALDDIGYPADPSARQVRGYRGQTVLADLTIPQGEGTDIGFRWNSGSGSYELVTDLDLWSLPIPVERFLSRLNQHYALRSILAASAAEGFQLAERQQQQDGSIELVVTRWDG